MIYTSYFAKLNKLPNNVFPVSISLTQPKDVNLLQIKFLTPTWDILNSYKKTGDISQYTLRFNLEILDKLSAAKVVEYLYRLSNGKDVALICYESPEKFCHRHLIAEWLIKNNIDCEEFKNYC